MEIVLQAADFGGGLGDDLIVDLAHLGCALQCPLGGHHTDHFLNHVYVGTLDHFMADNDLIVEPTGSPFQMSLVC